MAFAASMPLRLPLNACGAMRMFTGGIIGPYPLLQCAAKGCAATSFHRSAMSTKDELKARVCEAIDRRAEEIVGFATHILGNAEPGFREQKTSRFVREQFDALGLPHKDGLALTGVKAWSDGGTPGPSVAVIGELDSMIVAGHPYADPETNAAHACGHHCQIAMMLGVAMGLRDSGAMAELAGRVVLFAVPAEELIEVEYRKALRDQRKVEFIGGKSELVRLGEFDDVDMAMMTHTAVTENGGKIRLPGTSNGLVVKHIQYLGRGRPCRRFASQRDQRPQRRHARPPGGPRPPRNLPCRGYGPGPSHHHPWRRCSQRRARGRSHGDLRARQNPRSGQAVGREG